MPSLPGVPSGETEAGVEEPFAHAHNLVRGADPFLLGKHLFPTPQVSWEGPLSGGL